MKDSKLDKDRAQIRSWLALGVPKGRIAKNLSVDRTTLWAWLKKHQLSLPERPPLQAYAEQITDYVSIRLSNEVYALLSKEMETLERDKLWFGNGHHAAQRMHCKVIQVLKPVLSEVIHAEVLR